MAESKVNFWEEPACAVVNTKALSKTCSYCFGGDTLKRCAKCHTIYYCSAECQRNDWTDHRSECLALCQCPRKPDGTRHIPPAIVRLMQRFFLRAISGLDEVKAPSNFVEVHGGRDRDYSDLESHLAEFKKRLDKVEEFTTNLAVLQQYAHGGRCTIPHAGQLLEAYCKGVTRVSEVRLGYVDVLQRREPRQRELTDTYFFTCHCARCSDDLDDDKYHRLRCSHCSEVLPPAPRSQSEIACVKCKRETSRVDKIHLARQIEYFVDLVHRHFDRMESDPKVTFASLELPDFDHWEEAEKHFDCARNRDAMLFAACAVEMIVRDENAHESVRLHSLRDHMNKIVVCAKNLYGVGSGNPALTMALVRQGNAALLCAADIDDLKRAQSVYKTAKDFAKLSHGEGHPLCRKIDGYIARCQSMLPE